MPGKFKDLWEKGLRFAINNFDLGKNLLNLTRFLVRIKILCYLLH